MHISETFAMAMRSLRANRLRSALTTIGIIIGVSAVIVLVGLGDGIKAGFNTQFGALADQIVVSKLNVSVPGNGAPKDLKDSDVTALRNVSNAPAVASVTPVVNGTQLIEYRQKQYLSTLEGSTSEYLNVLDRQLMVGQMFTESQARSNARVVVIGPDVVTNLFNGDAASAVGKYIRITRSNFRVIGVVTSNGQQDDAAIMPLGAARAYLVGGNDRISQMIVKTASSDQVSAAQRQVYSIMDSRHNIKSPIERDYSATALQNLLDKASTFLNYLTLFTLAVAALSLVVGGIGVANIMLVSVTERTREIGIRKAIGARRSAILKQFLIESTILAGLGGVIGILIGVSVTGMAMLILPRVAPTFGTPDISAGAITVAFGLSLLIGLVAGGYPASRAAGLRPIEALRWQ
ncbi:MAG: putative transport system permease protein [Pseudonocardiales bacterium]|nr:putative transport system permease protein [Pseudonocardiales bacterium]